MGWKDLPAWLKGGIWGLGISLIAIASAIAFSIIAIDNLGYKQISSCPSHLIACSLGIIFCIVNFIFGVGHIIWIFIRTVICHYFPDNTTCIFPNLGLFIYFLPIVYFILGSLIGWIVGTIKTRIPSQKNNQRERRAEKNIL